MTLQLTTVVALHRASSRVRVRESSARGLPFLLGFGLVSALGADQGGYFETAWGWTALVFIWLCLIGLLLRPAALTGPEMAFVLSLTAFVSWVAISTIWAPSASQTIREVERDVIYAAGALAGLLIVRRSSYRSLLGGVWAGIFAIGAYSLSTRLFPSSLGTFDSIAGYRLKDPLGYWNALGIFVVIGSILAVGFAAHGNRALLRAIAAASLPVLLVALFFTYSRGAWIALFAGLLAAVLVSPRRLQLISVGLVLAIPCGTAVWIAWRSKSLTHVGTSLAAASHDGHRVAVFIGLLSAASAGLALGLKMAERRFEFGRGVRIACGTALTLVALGALTAVVVRFGSPWTIVRNAYHQLSVEAPRSTNLNERLFDFSSRGRVIQWRAARDDYEAHPWLGSGAGSYQQYWERHRPGPYPVRDAHSLYLEQLAEVGPVGLGLLGFGLGVPVVGAIRARRRRLVPLALGAYVAFLLHAGVDWDWEMPAVTLAALFCGAAILLAARLQANPRPMSSWLRAMLGVVLIAVASFCFVGLVGNKALASSKDAGSAGNWRKAEKEAQQAVDWAPWSSQALQQLASAQYGLGRRADAYRTLLKAVKKDSNNWSIWFDLGDASPDLRSAQRAYRRAAELNPRSDNINMLRFIGLLPKRAAN